MTARKADDFAPFGLPEAPLEEKELTLAFQRGDKGAYRAIYDRYAERVQGVCRRMLPTPEDAEEAAQETFIRMYQGLARFNGTYHLGAWITRIATNVCLDQIRARSRKASETALETVDGGDVSATDKDDPEVSFLRGVDRRRIRRVLMALPPTQRAAIVLRDFEAMSYHEIALTLGMTEPQVKALLHRARTKFKRSWIRRSASLLLPWRYVQRLDGASPIKEVASHGAASTQAVQAAQAASSCSTIVQQCGSYVTEHVAAVVAATVVGTAALSGISTPSRGAEPQGDPGAVSRSVAADGGGRKTDPLHFLGASVPDDGARAAHRDPLEERPPGDDATEDAATGEGDGAAVEPTPSPSASPTASASPSPSPSPTASATASPSPSPSGPAGGKDPEGQDDGSQEGPGPDEFAPQVGFETGDAIPRQVPRSHAVSLDCAAQSFDQRLETTFYDGDESYHALLALRASGEQAALELWLTKGDSRYAYSSAYSDPVVSWGSESEGGALNLEINGRYDASGKPRKFQKADLPESGTFSALLRVDCSRGAVDDESAIFSRG